MKAMLINGSPRRNWNTYQLLDSARKGAVSAGAEAEIIHLFSMEYTGCRSCFACKIKNAKTHGVCAIHDNLRPLLEKCRAADVIICGSPVYYGYPTGQLRSFVERLLFPLDTYMVDGEGRRVKILDKIIPSGMIFTMNCPEWYMEEVKYPTLLGFTGEELGRLLGYNEVLYSCDTYQFNDYSRYEINMFDETKKREHREKQFPIDLERAHELGRRLVEKAINEGKSSDFGIDSKQ